VKMLAKQKVLVVDDQPSACESVGKVLKKRGCEVEQVFDGQAAIGVLEKQRFDLAIVDLMMPRVSGMELLRYAREHHPEVEVVMITGYASIDSAVEATKIGAAGYIPKPFTPDELTAAAEKALHGREKRHQAEIPGPPAAEPVASEQIDVDMPFDRRELAAVTSDRYADALTRTDMPLPDVAAKPTWCPKGQMECQKFAESGLCKGECVILAREEKMKQRQQVAATPVDEGVIDVDLPFNFDEVAAATSLAYASMLGRSDLPLTALAQQVPDERKRILVIDDEPVACNSMRRILGRHGHRVDQALLPDEGLRRIKATRYDLVLTDLRMPGKDGLEVLDEIKQRWPETKVIIVTGYASIESAIEATRRGASQYIAKPFTPEELARATAAVLQEAA